MKPRHIIEAQQFDTKFLSQLIERTNWMRERYEQRDWSATEKLCRGKLMYSLFYEPSTRTRMSFETAATRLGMTVLGSEDAGAFSSRSKGETDYDSFKVLAGYRPDVMVVRHDKADGLKDLAESIDTPVINAGDGAGQHPTQALLDLYTIVSRLGRLENLNIVMVGDMKHGRTVRSLVYLLSKYPGNHFTFVAPEGLQMRSDILQFLEMNNFKYRLSADLEDSVKAADVLYVTRIQAERGMDQAAYNRVADQFRITPAELALMPESAIVLHPLPRVDTGTVQKVKMPEGVAVPVTLVNELDPACDADPRAAYFDQAVNGLLVRMALLEWVLS